MAFRIIKDERLDELVARANSTFDHDLLVRGNLTVEGCISAECCSQTKLMQSDFDAVPTTGIVIEVPGVYYLGENILFAPTVDSIAAITVRAHNVTLNFRGYTLSMTQAAFDSFDNITGVLVDSGFNNFSMGNGYLDLFSDQGVLVNTDNFVSTDHRNIIVSRLIVSNIGKLTTQTSFAIGSRGGINVCGADGVVVNFCQTSNVRAVADSEGMAVNYCSSILMDNCLSQSTEGENATGIALGIYVFSFVNATLNKCTATKTSAKFVIGIAVSDGSGIVLSNCSSHNNRSYGVSAPRGGFLAGIQIDSTNGFSLTDCTSQDNICEANSANNTRRNFCTGIQVGNSKGGTLARCSAISNFTGSQDQSAGGACVGFDINRSNGVKLTECLAQGNAILTGPATSGTIFGVAGGIDCDFSSNIIHENCTAIANVPRAGSISDPKACFGFYASIFPEGGVFSNIIYRNCTSIGHVTDIVGKIAAGFLIGEDIGSAILVSPTGIVIENCIVEENKNVAPGSENLGFGIGLMQGSTNCVCSKNTICRNGTGIYVKTNQAAPTQASSGYNMIENNKLVGNLFSAITHVSDVPNTNTFSKNYAYRNGVSNYVGLPPGTPVRTWAVGAPPALVDNNGILDPIDNIDIQ